MSEGQAALDVVEQVVLLMEFSWWPFVLKSTHDQVRRENGFLRSALKEANAELYKHRMLIGGLKYQQPDIVRAVEKAIWK